MPKVNSSGDKKGNSQGHRLQGHLRSDSVNDVESRMPVDLEDISSKLRRPSDSPFSQGAVERHAALLTDSRLSHPANAIARAQMVQQLQRDYGNRYVQRLVKYVSQENESDNRYSPKHELGDFQSEQGLQVTPSTIQRLIQPYESKTQFLKRFGKPNKKLGAALSAFYGKVKESVHIFSPDELAEGVRRVGKLTIPKINQLADTLEKAKSSDREEELGGENSHGLTRHLTISDAEMESRLRDEGIAKATRFRNLDNEGRSIIKLHNIIKAELPLMLKTQMQNRCEEIQEALASEEYSVMPNLAARRKFIKGQVEANGDDRDGFYVDYDWQIANAGITATQAVVKLRYQVTSVEEFVKDTWELNGEDEIVKSEEDAPAVMHSGGNSPSITVLNTDNAKSIAAKIKESGIENTGVTMY